MFESRLKLAGVAIATVSLLVLVSLAIGGGLAGGGTPAGAQVTPCDSPNPDSTAGMTFDPASAPPNVPVDADVMNLPSSSDAHSWVLMWDWSGVPGEDIIAQGEMPPSSAALTAGFTVPTDAAPGLHDVTFCYEHLVVPQSVGDPWFRVDAQFSVDAATPTPTPTPGPTPPSTPSPTIPGLVAIPVLPTPPPGFQAPQPPLLDLSIWGIEITQAIQCFNQFEGLQNCPDNSLPVVLNKSTTARTYLRVSDIPLPFQLAGVPVRLYLSGGGQNVTFDSYGTAKFSIGESTNDSANFWFRVKAGDDFPVSFYAEVDPDNVITETDETNNRFPASGTISMNFQKRETQDVVSWRMRYHPPGYNGEQYAGGWAVNGGGADWLEQVWPVPSGSGIDHSIKSGYLDWTTEITSSNRKAIIDVINFNWITQNLLAFIFGTGQFTGAEKVFVWAPDDHFVRGKSDPPYNGGLGVAGIGTDKPGTSIDSPGFGAPNFAHEVSHNEDLRHTSTDVGCDDSTGSTDWPYPDAGIQEFGYNPDTGSIYDPSDSYDLMSYCGFGASGQRNWISPFHWTKLFNTFPASAGSASVPGAVKATSASQSLAVTALIDNPDIDGDEGGTLGQLHRVDGGIEVLPAPGDGYAIELRDGDTVLATQTFSVGFDDHAGPNPPGESSPEEQAATETQVSFIMPWTPGAGSVALVRGGQTLDETFVSDNPPVVEFTSPAGPETWTAGSTETLTWEGSDADGDDLTYSILYTSSDDAWELIESGITGTSYDVEVDFFAGSDGAQFGVVATDGLNTGSDETPPITIPNKPPFVAITSPENGTVVIPGGLVVLSGSAVDLEDGSLPDESYKWTSDVDGDLGTGASLPLTSLSNGLHTITLTATDSGGESTSESVQVLVAVPASIEFFPDAVPPGGDPPDVRVVVILPWGFPTDTIDAASLELIVGDATLSPTSVTVLGDTDSDGLIELELTFDGAAVQDALPGGIAPATVMLTGELENGTQIQGVDTVNQVSAGDVDCDGDSDAVDALQVLRELAGLPANAACLFAADIDCDGDQDAVDALNILRNNAGLPFDQPVGCPQISAVSASGGGSALPALPSFLWLSVVFVVPALVVTRRRLIR